MDLLIDITGREKFMQELIKIDPDYGTYLSDAKSDFHELYMGRE